MEIQQIIWSAGNSFMLPWNQEVLFGPSTIINLQFPSSFFCDSKISIQDTTHSLLLDLNRLQPEELSEKTRPSSQPWLKKSISIVQKGQGRRQTLIFLSLTLSFSTGWWVRDIFWAMQNPANRDHLTPSTTDLLYFSHCCHICRATLSKEHKEVRRTHRECERTISVLRNNHNLTIQQCYSWNINNWRIMHARCIWFFIISVRLLVYLILRQILLLLLA